MKESRIRQNTLILLGATIFLIIALVSAWYFALVRPQQALLARSSTQYQSRLAVAQGLSQALSDQKKAEDQLQYVNGQFDFVRQRYRNLYFADLGQDYATETPIQKGNREAIWRYWMNYYYNGYGPALKKELQDYATTSGVHIASSISVVPPPNKPEDVAPPATGLLKPLSGGGAATASPSGPSLPSSYSGGSSLPSSAPSGSGGAAASGGGSMSVTVTGPLPNILRYFNSLNNNATLVKVGTIKLDTEAGQPGTVRATFTLTPYLLAAGPGAPFPGSPSSGFASSSSASGSASMVTASALRAPTNNG